MATTYLTKIKGFLYKNPLTEDPNDYIARVESQRSLDVAQVCASATSRGGADIGASAMEHAVELFLAEMEYQLCNGFSVNAKTFTAAPHIKGVFNSPYETFDPAKHRLLCEFSQGLQLRQKLTATEVVIEGVRESNFHIDHIKDMFTNNTDGSVTRGKVTELRGHNIKIAGTDDTCGIWLRVLPNGTETRVDMSAIVLNEPSRILVQLPDLGYNTPQQLSIKTQYSNSGGKLLEHPRTAVLDIPVVEVEQGA
ncbi:hypothetical protein AGMMS4956_10160 [Bacteroidia bacterium]|nr:hypothetical protein AGMMS4956_10160 [Bacteroidia bacterium]